MPEILILIIVLATWLAFTRVLRTRVSKNFCLCIATLFTIGHGMNIVVIRANGGKMPVLEGERDWDNAPSINLPQAVDIAVFDNYLPKMQKFILLTDEPHRIIPEEKIDEVRLTFLADKHPIKIGDRRSLYSLGDVFVVLGTCSLFIGFIPIWLIARRSWKRQTS